jgi:hypothetical protein
MQDIYSCRKARGAEGGHSSTLIAQIKEFIKMELHSTYIFMVW